MLEQSKGRDFQMFSWGQRRSSSSGGAGKSSTSSSSRQDQSAVTSSGSKGADGGYKNGNFVSRLGFKFNVANFEINAVSPTSW